MGKKRSTEKPLNGDPEVIEWKGIKLKATYSTRLTCHYHGHSGGMTEFSAPLHVELKHLTKKKWSAVVSVYGLPSSMFRECDFMEEVELMLGDCLDGLISLMEDGLVIAKELRDDK